ncbi:MAG: hypothetical protein N2484_14170 [Clostridia bacterium]|nr:hypothetical protein [Clostridia bacterium]
MPERPLIKRHYYKIPLNEKFYIFSKRATILVYYLIRFKLRKIIPSEFKKETDVYQKYFPLHELNYVKRKLGIEKDDAMAAVKLLTYFHTLTGVIGQIIEMTPERAVRIESYCPAYNKFSKEFCSEVMSYPVFCSICRVLNPRITHTHETYLSGGDDTCKLVFELEK